MNVQSNVAGTAQHSCIAYVTPARSLLVLCALVALLLVSQPHATFAHPADITVTDFFVERDEDNTVLADTRLKAVHSLNWFEAMDVLGLGAAGGEVPVNLDQHEVAVTTYVEENLQVHNAGEACSFENVVIPAQTTDELSAVGFFFTFDVVCSMPITELSVTATFLLEKYPDQSNFLTLYRFPGDLIMTDSLHAERPTAMHTISSSQADQPLLELFSAFVHEGMHHIIPLGLDHILFIATVFLIADSVRRVILYSLIFTAAHSVTLALTALGIITPPSVVVESVIALSIIVLAIDAMYPFIPRVWHGVAIFCFGLFHGMGFAGVLAELGLPAGAEIAALLGFNAGVEIGQLAVICLLYGGTWWFFADTARRRRTTIAMAASIALIATYWLIERTLL